MLRLHGIDLFLLLMASCIASEGWLTSIASSDVEMASDPATQTRAEEEPSERYVIHIVPSTNFQAWGRVGTILLQKHFFKVGQLDTSTIGVLTRGGISKISFPHSRFSRTLTISHAKNIDADHHNPSVFFFQGPKLKGVPKACLHP